MSLKRTNVVYVFPDQLRASALGYAGNPNVLTPNLDRLAGQSVNFQNAVAVAPVCGPSRAALQTGRFPTTTGIFMNDLHLPAEELCMPEVFAKAGYDTGYIGKWHLDGHGRSAFIPPARRQGWAFWQVAECDHDNYTSHYYEGDSPEKKYWQGYDVFAQTEAARDYVRQHARKNAPFFLTLSFGAPHPASSEPPEEYLALYDVEKILPPPNVPAELHNQARQSLHRYYAHITAIDHAVGELLKTIDEAGIAENTVFIFTSDHGGMLESHGLPGHWKQVAFAESSRIPFLLRYPAAHGHEARVVNTPLNITDIFPTLLGLVGIDVPDTVEGDDLSALITRGGEIPDRAALYMSVAPFEHSSHGGAYRAIKTERHTYVRNLDGPFMLFDDLGDPFQMHNLVEQPGHQDTVQALDRKLQAELDKIGDDFRPPEAYLERWGYTVNERNAIPYEEGATTQAPNRRVNYC